MLVRKVGPAGIALGLAVAGIIGYAAWRIGSPWSKAQCIREATALPTEIGVRASLQQCAKQFGPLTQ